MVRGSKAKYTSKQKRQARHIEEGYENRGTSRRRAAEIAWATVNKETGGGRLGGRLGTGRSRAVRPHKKTTRSK
jgi:plasmid stabilization system protein ParE